MKTKIARFTSVVKKTVIFLYIMIIEYISKNDIIKILEGCLMDINIGELKKICLDFFKLAGMEFSLWDENMRNIYSYPTPHSCFCKTVREDWNLYMKCQNCDKAGLNEVNRTKQPYTYCCHMGLTEAILPILQENEIVGYLMLGQIAEEENEQHINECIEKSCKNADFKSKLSEYLKDVTSCSHQKVEYCINTLKVLIEYMNLSYVIQKTGDTVFYRAKKYIVDNISSPIMPQDICKNIGVSSNMLYKAIHKTVGTNPTGFIRKIKIDEAIHLLLRTSDSISQIAEAVGFNDTNYFIRVFKKEIGVSPLKYKKHTYNK